MVDEPYKYHPHVTLAQGLDPHYAGVFELASRRWKEGARPVVRGGTLTFVQNKQGMSGSTWRSMN